MFSTANRSDAAFALLLLLLSLLLGGWSTGAICQLMAEQQQPAAIPFRREFAQ
jgi:hypothetical protein